MKVKSKNKELGQRLGSLKSLPPELLAELNVKKIKDNDQDIIDVINAYDGEATLDEILVGLYKRKGTLETRQKLTMRLYKLIRAGNLKSIEGKRGAYSTG